MLHDDVTVVGQLECNMSPWIRRQVKIDPDSFKNWETIERVMDVAAGKIGMDPAELRRRNFIPPDRFPLTTNTGAAW